VYIGWKLRGLQEITERKAFLRRKVTWCDRTTGELYVRRTRGQALSR
jgi:hypothetical protein